MKHLLRWIVIALLSFSTQFSPMSGGSPVDIKLDTENVVIESVYNRVAKESYTLTMLKDYEDAKKSVYKNLPISAPIKRENLSRISDYYRWRPFHPVLKRPTFHRGMDFAASIGTPVLATGNGIVTRADYGAGYGNVIEIDHGFEFESIYAHLNGFNVKEGDTISRGDVIGYVGSTGISTGPHLHYEIRKNRRAINPVSLFIDDPDYSDLNLYLELLFKIRN